jgi:CubicO group peptidase (beta-lactamase class C family)
MKKIVLIIAALYTVYYGHAQKASVEIDTIVSTYQKLKKFNGAVLVAKNGTVLLNKGYGYRNVAGNVPNDEQTIFQLGSITKQFTAAIILKLQQENKLNVQDKLSKYFPDFPKGDSITIENLLLHTSGIYNYTNDEKFMAAEVANPASREKIMALFKDKPLDFSPGTAWNYSNSGYSLLGYIIEITTKKPYEQVVRNYIFNPLQMNHSGFDFTHLKNPKKAIGYFALNDKDSIEAPIVDSTVSYSAGAIYSTTGDLYKWHQALQNYSILTKAQQEKAYTPVKNKYGYGWGIDTIEGKRNVGHGGGIHGFVTNISRVPEDDICIVLLSNASDNSLQDITKSIFSVLYNKPYELPKRRTVIAVTQEKLKDYIGEYEIRPTLHVVISIKDGELLASPTGQKPNFLYAEKEDFFFLKDIDIEIEFKRNEKKEIDSFILHQNGAKIPCKKIK